MAYYVTPDLGLELANPLTIQAFETVNVNDNFLTLEAGIMADRVRLTTAEADVALLEDGLGTLGTASLDTFTTKNGVYTQQTMASATLARNYPVNGVGGILVVFRDSNSVTQVYYTRAASRFDRVYTRSKFSTDPWTAWMLTTPSGPKGMVPSAVNGGTVSEVLDGTVTFSGTSSVTLEDCFTSEFENYEIIIDAANASAANLQLILANNLTPVLTTEYDNTRLTFVGATVASVQTLNTNLMQISPISTSGRHVGRVLISRPFLADRTMAVSQFAAYPTIPTAATGGSQVASHFSLSTSFDGFRLAPDAGTISGSLKVIGLN